MRCCRTRWLILFLLLVSYGCATTNTNNAAVDLPGCNLALDKQALVSAPKKICILPVKVDIGELSAGGSTEIVPDWSTEGTKLVKQCVYKHCDSNLGLEIVPLSELSEENKLLLDQYRALYELTAANKQYIDSIPAWSHQKGYVATLGTGMAGLRQQLGADAILFVSGYDFHSTAGRKTAFVLYAALTGAALPMGHCKLHTGLVELESGNILWTYTNMHPSYSLKNEKHVEEMIRKSFSGFPTAARQEGAHVQAQ